MEIVATSWTSMHTENDNLCTHSRTLKLVLRDSSTVHIFVLSLCIENPENCFENHCFLEILKCCRTFILCGGSLSLKNALHLQISCTKSTDRFFREPWHGYKEISWHLYFKKNVSVLLEDRNFGFSQLNVNVKYH